MLRLQACTTTSGCDSRIPFYSGLYLRSIHYILLLGIFIGFSWLQKLSFTEFNKGMDDLSFGAMQRVSLFSVYPLK